MIGKQNIIRGAFFIIASELSLAISAALIKKLAATSLPNESIVFFRNLFGILFLMPLILQSNAHILKTERLHLHLMRAGFGMGAMYSLFYSLGHIPLGNSMLIKSTIPLMIPFLSVAWLGEQITPRVIMAGGIGFLGVFLILQPDGNSNWVSLIALTSSVLAAFSFVTVRKLSATEPPLRIVFYFALLGLMISFLPMVNHWQAPTREQYIMLTGIGLMATTGQLLLTRGYQNAPASTVGIFTYTSVPFGTFIGWLVWNEVLDLNFLLGAGLIITAGIIILRGKQIINHP